MRTKGPPLCNLASEKEHTAHTVNMKITRICNFDFDENIFWNGKSLKEGFFCRIIHLGGFTREERLQRRFVIINNIVQSVYHMLVSLPSLKLFLDTAELKVRTTSTSSNVNFIPHKRLIGHSTSLCWCSLCVFSLCRPKKSFYWVYSQLWGVHNHVASKVLSMQTHTFVGRVSSTAWFIFKCAAHNLFLSLLRFLLSFVANYSFSLHGPSYCKKVAIYRY